MSRHGEKAVARDHGPLAGTCDHDGSTMRMHLGVAVPGTRPQDDVFLFSWCNRCGALHVNGEWRRPSALPRVIDVLRSLRMTEEVDWRRDVMDAALAGIDSPSIQTAPRYVLADQYDAAVRDRDAMCATLTTAQERGTTLVEENRALRARLAALEAPQDPG